MMAEAVHLAAALGLYRFRKDLAFFTTDRRLYKVAPKLLPVVEVPGF